VLPKSRARRRTWPQTGSATGRDRAEPGQTRRLGQRRPTARRRPDRRQTREIINKHKVGKHFITTVTDETFSYRRDEDKITAEAALDGIYVIRTGLGEEKTRPGRRHTRLSETRTHRTGLSLHQIRRLGSPTGPSLYRRPYQSPHLHLHARLLPHLAPPQNPGTPHIHRRKHFPGRRPSRAGTTLKGSRHQGHHENHPGRAAPSTTTPGLSRTSANSPATRSTSPASTSTNSPIRPPCNAERSTCSPRRSPSPSPEVDTGIPASRTKAQVTARHLRVPEILHVAVDLPVRHRRRTGMIHRWR
jgi:hypothetical protein